MSGGPDTQVIGAGIVSPIGLSLAETAAAARARVARLREIAWLDRRYDPFIAGTVPDEGLPELAAPLAEQPLTYREQRMLRLAHAALDEALAALPPGMPAPPLLLGLPEHHTALPIDARLFLGRLAVQRPGGFDPASSLAAPRGRAAALLGLRQAAAWLQAGTHPFVLVGGVDCLVDLYLLGTLDQQGRIRNAEHNDGFSPAEGAAFLLLARSDAAQRHGCKPLATLLGSGHGQEPGHLYADEPYRGDGLAAAFAQLLAAAPPPRPIASVFCSFNGERYWAREFGVARTRSAAAFAPAHGIDHPAECFGDLGAAHGAALAALAAHAVQQGYRPAPCLVYASSDRGERSALLLDRAA